MDTNDTLSGIVLWVTHPHLDAHDVELAEWRRYYFAPEHPYNGWISRGVEIAVEAIHGSRRQLERPDEVDERQLVERRGCRNATAVSCL